MSAAASTWSQQAKLTAADAAANDESGSSVALSGDGSTALVGAYYKTVASNQSRGAGYVFTRTGRRWNQHGGADGCL